MDLEIDVVQLVTALTDTTNDNSAQIRDALTTMPATALAAETLLRELTVVLKPVPQSTAELFESAYRLSQSGMFPTRYGTDLRPINPLAIVRANWQVLFTWVNDILWEADDRQGLFAARSALVATDGIARSALATMPRGR